MSAEVELFFAGIDDFDDGFYEKNSKSLSSLKSFSNYRGAPHQKESVLAWSIVDEKCRKRGVAPKLLFSEKGKPSLAGDPFFFNISHSHGRVIVAFSHVAVGADVEFIDERDHEKLFKRVLSKAEAALLLGKSSKNEAFFRLWTLKESALKLSGEGISGGFEGLDFSAHIGDDAFELNGLHYRVSRLLGCSLAVCCTEEFDLQFKQIKENDYE